MCKDKNRMRCSCGKYLFLTAGIGLGIAALVVLVFAYLVPLIQYSDYSLQACKVTTSKIIQEGTYHGIVTLSYLSLSQDLDVYQNAYSTAVQTYLDINYKIGSLVQCLVSGSDIRVSIFTSNIGLGFTIALLILSVIAIGIFVVLLVIERHRRIEYIELDGTKP